MGKKCSVCAKFEVGDRVYVEGRVQSRPFTKVIDGVAYDKTAYEVSVQDISLLEENVDAHISYEEDMVLGD